MTPVASPPTGQSRTEAAVTNPPRSRVNPRSTSVHALGPTPQENPAVAPGPSIASGSTVASAPAAPASAFRTATAPAPTQAQPRPQPVSQYRPPTQAQPQPAPQYQPPTWQEVALGPVRSSESERDSRGIWFFVAIVGIVAVVCLALLLKGGSQDASATPNPAASTSQNAASNAPSTPPATKSENGALADSELAEIPGGHLLAVPAAQAFERLSAAMKKAGVEFDVNSAYRTVAQQQALVDELGLLEDGGKAAAVGTSEHGWGTAVDMTLNWDGVEWLRENAAAYGFAETIAAEPWHWNFMGE